MNRDSALLRHALPLYVAAEEGPIELNFGALQAYHGHGALAMLALTFQGLRGALEHLEIDGQPVPRAELSVISGHPGPGVRDAFEFVTRAVTRGCYVVDPTLPYARYARPDNKSYSFLLDRGGRRVRAVLRPGVLPPRFFDLLVQGDTDSRRQHAALRREIAERVPGQAPEELFEYALLDDRTDSGG